MILYIYINIYYVLYIIQEFTFLRAHSFAVFFDEKPGWFCKTRWIAIATAHLLSLATTDFSFDG